jgi:ABC-type transport system involved in multi-copper enzyme maturation permease subunit
MLANKQIAYALLIIGIVLAVLSVLIDPIRGHSIYMATSQIIVLIVGIVVALAGAYLAFMRKPAA